VTQAQNISCRRGPAVAIVGTTILNPERRTFVRTG
jgi:hypothetical protein